MIEGNNGAGSLSFNIDPDETPPGGAIRITVPAVQRGLFALRNDTEQDLTVEITDQSVDSPTAAAGEAALLSSDGTDVRAEGSGGDSTLPYDVMVFLPGTYDAGASWPWYCPTGDVSFPADLSGFRTVSRHGLQAPGVVVCMMG